MSCCVLWGRMKKCPFLWHHKNKHFEPLTVALALNRPLTSFSKVTSTKTKYVTERNGKQNSLSCCCWSVVLFSDISEFGDKLRKANGGSSQASLGTLGIQQRMESSHYKLRSSKWGGKTCQKDTVCLPGPSEWPFPDFSSSSLMSGHTQLNGLTSWYNSRHRSTWNNKILR